MRESARLLSHDYIRRGKHKKERAQALWKEIESLYESNGIPACRRLKKLTVKDVQKPGKAAVLGANAEVRHFCTDTRAFGNKQEIAGGQHA